LWERFSTAIKSVRHIQIRTKQPEYTWLRSLMKKHADFRQATQDGLDFALDVFNITEPQLRNDLIDA
jgi:2-haloacid dehalogenase